MKKIITIVILSIFLVGCGNQENKEEKYYELTLPKEIVSNQIDNEKLKPMSWLF
ncbi:MAG: hypothetical protein ACOX02_00875 [Acholeplasmatales bacterium]